VDLGVLLSVPLESVAIRAVLATVLTVALVRALLRAGLRSPGARVAAALAPAAALAVVLLLSGTGPRPPMVMLPARGAEALPIPVGDGYLHFVPMAVPLLLGVWATVAGWRLFRRARRTASVRAKARHAVSAGHTDPRLERLAAQAADALEVPRPTLAMLPECPGGAYVVGTRQPVVVLGADLVGALDDEELEGVLAHELAHVRRRDTQVANLLGILRDITFFVPGGGWAMRQLHRERELAADQAAVAATGRPGALAGGLLKVLERRPAHPDACAALAPSANLVDRVRVLVDDTPAPGRLRRGSETVTVAVVAVAAVAGAIAMPATATGPDRERDAVALVWSASQPAAADVPAGEPRAFDVYRRSDLDISERSIEFHGARDEHSQENRRAALHACASDTNGCPVPDRSPSLGMVPPQITVDDAVTARWQATPVGNSEAADGFRMFWLARQGD
jgi:beta-lactamase regulating signal transducer with metallopeptidase domain